MKRGEDTSPTGVLDLGHTDQVLEEGAGGATQTTAGPRATVPSRADGIVLIGEFEQSGFEQPPSLVRRKDGQVVQLTELLYLTLEAVDGERDLDAIAAEVTRSLGRTATADNVRFLLDEKLRPLGLLKNPDGTEPAVRKSNPLLALRWKLVLAGEHMTNRLTAPFGQLFRGPVVPLVIAGFVAVCVWVLFMRGVAQGTRQALYSPALLVMVFALTVLSAGFHEFGHAAACRYGGARPGAMGAGVYLVWPAFYTDVTDAYRLDRRGRLRTALGGLYFNGLFILLTFGAWAVTRSEVFLLFVPLQLFQMLHQLLPVVRMDGYYILADITGVPDLFARIKPTLKSAIPGQETQEHAIALKRWVRVTVTAWVLIVVPVLAASVVLAVISLPRMAATAWDSLGHQWDGLTRNAVDGSWLGVASGGLAVLALLLPVAASVLMLGRTGHRLTKRTWNATSARPLWRTTLVIGAAAAVAGAAWLWWPNGEYRPIGPGERGTLSEGINAVRQVGTGRPGLTPEREQELEATPDAPLAPTQSPLEDKAGAQDEPTAESTATTATTATASEGEPAPAPVAPPAGRISSTTVAPAASTPVTPTTLTDAPTPGAQGETTP